METITDMLEHMDRTGQPAITVQDPFGRTVAVIVRVQPGRPAGLALAPSLKPRGRTPKDTPRSKRQRDAAKRKRLRGTG